MNLWTPAGQLRYSINPLNHTEWKRFAAWSVMGKELDAPIDGVLVGEISQRDQSDAVVYDGNSSGDELFAEYMRDDLREYLEFLSRPLKIGKIYGGGIRGYVCIHKSGKAIPQLEGHLSRFKINFGEDGQAESVEGLDDKISFLSNMEFISTFVHRMANLLAF